MQVNTEPITSGYRLQLMYDLHASQTIQKIISGKPSASHVSQQANKFRHILGQWTALSQRHQGPVPLVYIRDDEPGDYKRKLLSCASLKGAETPREASKEENHLNQWVQDRLRGALDRVEVVEEQDGRALISIGKKHGRDLVMNQ